MTFAEKLRELRVKAGLSQKALADVAGVAQAAIGHWETGERSPAWEKVQALCKALGVKCTVFEDCTTGPPPDEPVMGRPKKPTPDAEEKSPAKAGRKRKPPTGTR